MEIKAVMYANLCLKPSFARPVHGLPNGELNFLPSILVLQTTAGFVRNFPIFGKVYSFRPLNFDMTKNDLSFYCKSLRPT